MQRIGLLMAIGTAWLAASGAQAQVREGDLRLYLDAALVSWAKEVTETEGTAVLDGESESTTLSTGLFGAGGAGVGYAISPHLLPQLYLSLQNVKVDLGDGDVTVRQWELRPCLEVPLLPDARFVPYLMAGMTLGRTVTKGDGSSDLTRFGLGPALGVGAHGFLTQHASLDLGLTFRGTFFVKNELEDDLPNGVEINVKQYALLLTVGASFWL